MSDIAANLADLRSRVITEAEGWLGTPYHHMGRIKRAGVDCLTLLAEVYPAAGILEPVTEIPFYRPDFMFHSDSETYLDGLLQHGHPVAEPSPGDVAIFKHPDWRIYGHAAIVTHWPELIHSTPGHRHGCCRGNAKVGFLRLCAVKFISPFQVA